MRKVSLCRVRRPCGGIRAGVPRVEMGVEVQQGDRPVVDLLQGPQRRERDAVVAAQRDDFRMGVRCWVAVR